MRISNLILHNDHQLVALCKPCGMPVQEDRTGDPSLHRLAQAYCKRDLYPVNRIDRPCSGVVLFAKTPAAAAKLQQQWQEQTVSKEYYVIVPEGLTPEEGTLHNRLTKRGNKCIVLPESESSEGTKAELEYRIVHHLVKYLVLVVHTKTGLYHQIRAQFGAAGFPVKGDVKYGARRSNKDRSICLHCAHITLIHPGSGAAMTIHCIPPETDVWVSVDKEVFSL